MKISKSVVCFVLAAGASAFTAGPALAQAPQYTVTDLGTLGGGFSNGLGISNSGRVTGYSRTSSNMDHAFLYSNGTMTDLGTLFNTDANSGSEGASINDVGQVTGVSWPNGPYTPHAFLYSEGSMIDLGSLGGIGSAGTAINNSGKVTGTSPIIRADIEVDRAFTYFGGTMTDLGSLYDDFGSNPPSYSSTSGSDINNSGQVTGTTTLPFSAGYARHAFVYSDGQMTDFGSLNGNSFGTAINDAGQVAGYFEFSGFYRNHVFVYSGGQMADLGTIPGYDNCYANAINNLGQVVGFCGPDRNRRYAAFLYSAGTMYDLNDLVPAGSRRIIDAAGINDLGQIVATSGVSGFIQEHALLLTPVPPIQIVLSRGTPSAFSNASPGANIDEPLIPTTAPTVLAQQPSVTSGLVADGVTPLIIKITAGPGPTGGPVRLAFGGWFGGSLASPHPALMVLGPGGWAAGSDVPLDPITGVGYAFIQGIPAEAIDTTHEVSAQLTAMLGPTTTSTTVRFRKPPIILVHGYNTAGTWGSDFKDILRQYRPDDFVRDDIVYGVDQNGNYDANTYGTLANLANELHATLLSQVDPGTAPFYSQWAFSRYDVVAHSQGGVLARMLCSGQKNLSISPFRSEANFFRGRFRRVITIGSPHNGSRMARHLWNLARKPGILSIIPSAMIQSPLGSLLQTNGTVQPKFDPWGEQIRNLNTPGSRWRPDAAAKFSIIRTSINDGYPPGIGATPPIPAYFIMGLGNFVTGPLVLPRGSDGVVDLDSAGGASPNYVYTFTGVDIAHAESFVFAPAFTTLFKSLKIRCKLC